jgi:hypothetical protein
MTGTPSISATLAAAIAAAFNGKPLTAANDTGSLAPVADVVAALQASSTASIAALGNAIALLGSAAQESAVVNVLTKTLAAANLAGIQSLTGSYVAFPSLVSTPSAPAPGTYKGTLTLTFVQT